MSVETLERTALALGFESLEAFVRLKLTEHIEQSIAEYKALIANFTQKYHVDYANFLLHFHQIEGFPLFEKEDDSLNWEVTLHRLAHAEGLLEKQLQ